MVGWFQALFLGLLQGLTEFLPISSSAHLRIFPDLFGWQDPGASFTAVVQIGTELAVLLYFRKDIWNIVNTWTESLFRRELRRDPNALMGWYVILGTIPIAIGGIAFQDQIKTGARNLWIVAVMLILGGLVLAGAERFATTSRAAEDLRLRDGVLCGLAQAAALVPGVSRSGATISMGLVLGMRREVATRFAFLLAIPAVVAAGIFQLEDVASGDSPYTGTQIVGSTVVAFVVGYAAIAWLLRYVSTHSYTPFVRYRIVLGALVLVLLAFGTLDARSDVGVSPATTTTSSAGVPVLG